MDFGGVKNFDWRAVFFGFNGRFNRGKYWLFSVLALAVTGFLTVLMIYMFPIPEEVIASLKSETLQEGIVYLVLVAPSVTFLYISSAISVKRLHDRNRSGWWAILYLGLPALLALIMGIAAGAKETLEGWPAALMIPYFILLIVTFVELACLKGTTGPNKYGPDPLAGLAPRAHLSTAGANHP
jgi:uncharacterized membrane protein YhaH (DUF805 family)